MAIKELTGQITSITHAPEVVILGFQETDQVGVVAVSIPNNQYHTLFPAGNPVMGQTLIAVIKQERNSQDQMTVTVESMYDPEDDFIAADEINGVNLLTDAEHDIYAELKDLRDQQIARIEMTDEELIELAHAHDVENAAKPIVNHNYGDIVVDSIAEGRV